jgi:T5SS/PEP-CTERM-associated repeat protein
MARAQTILGDTDIVTIPGTHASPWNTDSLFVGFASGDDAELRIGDGVLPGTVLSTTVYVGNAAGGQGTATLTGTGSEWFASGQFSVGFGGTGLVTIQEGARLVTDNAVVLARLVGSVGQMTVRDATWDVTGTIGALYVGHEGQGVLRLEEGAVVDASSRAVRLGHMSTGVGSVTITGDASLLADSLIVGGEGEGELTLQNGGTVVVNGGDGTLSIAQAAGSTGRLNIGGSVGTGGASAPTAVRALWPAPALLRVSNCPSYGSLGNQLSYATGTR